jgi:hypothetical protein
VLVLNPHKLLGAQQHHAKSQHKLQHQACSLLLLASQHSNGCNNRERCKVLLLDTLSTDATCDT